MECFDDVHTGGGKIESFVSYCGGLPAPEASVKDYFNMLFTAIPRLFMTRKKIMLCTFLYKEDNRYACQKNVRLEIAVNNRQLNFVYFGRNENKNFVF